MKRSGSCLVLWCLVLVTPVSWAEAEAPIAKEIALIIASKQHPLLLPGNFANRAEDLAALYQANHYLPLWLGAPTTAAQVPALLAVLADAEAHGLQAEHYHLETLQKKWSALALGGSANLTEQASYDTALSLSLLRFLHDLHYGRISPQGINFNLKLREKKFLDLPGLILAAAQRQTLAQLPSEVEPKLKQYQQLKAVLAEYRQVAAHTQPLTWTFSKAIKPGEALPEATELRNYLNATGDLPVGQKTGAHANSRYSDDLVVAMKKFQRRHGLQADGVIGKSTVTELATGLTRRVEQISLAMERLRWLPEELASGPSIIVNIPAFQLWALNDMQDLTSTVKEMRVVVGKAMKNQTPVLMAEMSYVEFAPYWNVPYNIVKDELIPKLMKSGPGFLAKENMELVGKSGVVVFSEGTIGQLKQGVLRVRQKPGKKNALGQVKFLFPNKDDVYLHDTPANALFSRSRRDFSHGCVRVDEPMALAEFALHGQWDKARIEKAMNSPKMQRVVLKKPIPVLFFYTTAFFDHTNQLVFYPDIYNQDTVLQEALKQSEDLSDQALFVGSTTTARPEIANLPLETVEEGNKP